MNTIRRAPLHRVFCQQVLATLLISLVIIPFGWVLSYSFFLGCLIQMSGSLYFACLAFRYMGAHQTKNAVQAMYRGESGKVILTMVMFTVVFIDVKPASYLSVFVGYAVMHALQLVLTAKLLKRND